VRCPYCAAVESKVVDSRDTETGIRRRRECLVCSRRFTTYERIEATHLTVVKKDGHREEFSRQKLLAGLLIASTKRGIASEEMEALAEEVENRLRGERVAEVASRVIGERVMELLRDIDEIAYVRFASVYRSFKDVADMRAEIEDVLTHAPETRRSAGRRAKPRGAGEELALDLGK
jgi:transcriptional repressor NrdR